MCLKMLCRYVHVGGDEARFEIWQESEHVRQGSAACACGGWFAVSRASGTLNESPQGSGRVCIYRESVRVQEMLTKRPDDSVSSCSAIEPMVSQSLPGMQSQGLLKDCKCQRPDSKPTKNEGLGGAVRMDESLKWLREKS